MQPQPVESIIFDAREGTVTVGNVTHVVAGAQVARIPTFKLSTDLQEKIEEEAVNIAKKNSTVRDLLDKGYEIVSVSPSYFLYEEDKAEEGDGIYIKIMIPEAVIMLKYEDKIAIVTVSFVERRVLSVRHLEAVLWVEKRETKYPIN
jgi:hypothetical protein